jgi:molybdate transport system ATP-binding protein
MTRGWVKIGLDEFTLENHWAVEPGSVLVLFGPSGSGKTMTLRAIAGLVAPESGHIQIGKQTVYDSSARIWVPPHQRRVGYLPQEYHLFPHLDAAGNIAFGLEGKAAKKRQRVAELLSIFKIEGLERRKVWELSGGERQRVALARALATDPAVLLLDEPFSALDMEVRREVRREVRGILKRAGMPVVLVTHDREDALALGDVVQVIDRGQPVASGMPIDILGYPRQGRVSQLIGVENLIPLTVAELQAQEGVMGCCRGNFRLEVPLADAREGEQVTVGIRARDIVLASSEPAGLSARNLIPGWVESVELHGAAYEVVMDCSTVLLRCHVTRRAVAELAITAGTPLWAVIKTSSCFIVNSDEEVTLFKYSNQVKARP